MSQITVAPVSAERFEDAELTLTGGGDGRSCQCQWWLLTSREFSETTVEQREQLFRDEVDASPVPGLVAYSDGKAAGWVRVGPRTRQPRLARTRSYAPNSEHDWDDADVWAVSCFSVRREFRGEGVTAALLDAAVGFARDQGARIVEGYPIDPNAGRKISSNELYHGALSTFLAAGFREVARPKPHVTIVSLQLT